MRQAGLGGMDRPEAEKSLPKQTFAFYIQILYDGIMVKRRSVVASVITVAIASGCQRSQNMPRTMIFFCGCAPCAELVGKLGKYVDRGSVYFAGSPGDASTFQRKYGLQRVVADVSGELASKEGVGRCPAVLVVRGQERHLYGNGNVLRPDELEVVKEALSE